MFKENYSIDTVCKYFSYQVLCGPSKDDCKTALLDYEPCYIQCLDVVTLKMQDSVYISVIGFWLTIDHRTIDHAFVLFLRSNVDQCNFK